MPWRRCLAERLRSPRMGFQTFQRGLLWPNALCPLGSLGSWPSMSLSPDPRWVASPRLPGAAQCCLGVRSRLGPPPLHEAPGKVRGRGPCVSWAVSGSASGPPVQRVLGASPSFYRRVDALLLLAGLGVVGQHPSVREWVCGRSRLAFPYTCSQRGAVAAATRPLRDTETPGPGERCRASSFKGRQDLRRRGCGGGCFVLLARNLGLGFVARVLLHSLPRCPALPLYIVNKQYRSTRCRLQSDSFCFGSVG